MRWCLAEHWLHQALNHDHLYDCKLNAGRCWLVFKCNLSNLSILVLPGRPKHQYQLFKVRNTDMQNHQVFSINKHLSSNNFLVYRAIHLFDDKCLLILKIWCLCILVFLTLKKVDTDVLVYKSTFLSFSSIFFFQRATSKQ